jgi:pheromone shutdown protein TraB
MSILVKTPDLNATLNLFDPKNTVAKAIVRLGDALDMKQNKLGDAFIDGKYIELLDYIDAHASSDPIKASEMPVMIKAWIAEQDAFIAKVVAEQEAVKIAIATASTNPVIKAKLRSRKKAETNKQSEAGHENRK